MLSRRLAATESIAVQWVLTAPHPMGSPFDNGFVCIVSLVAPLKNGPPLFVPWVTMGGPTHSWVATHQLNPLKPHLQRISKITVCSRKLAKRKKSDRTPFADLLLRQPERKKQGLEGQGAVVSDSVCRFLAPSSSANIRSEKTA